MVTQDQDMEIHALAKRKWKKADIARHVGVDRKTVYNVLSGRTTPGVRARSEPDPFDRVEPYVVQRFADDPHVWASALFDEVVGLGYDRSYQTFTRHLRDRDLRPHCEACSSSNGRAHADIDHPPGEEMQWDWVDLPGAPWLDGNNGLSPSVITRLTRQWQADQRVFAQRRLDDRDFVYVWADGSTCAWRRPACALWSL